MELGVDEENNVFHYILESISSCEQTAVKNSGRSTGSNESCWTLFFPLEDAEKKARSELLISYTSCFPSEFPA